MRTHPALFLVLSLGLAACTKPCKEGTVFVRLTFDNAAAAADAIVLTISSTSKTVDRPLVRTAGRLEDTLAVAFPDGYPRDAIVYVDVVATLGGTVVGGGRGEVLLADACETLTIGISGDSLDGGTGDGHVSSGDAAACGPCNPPHAVGVCLDGQCTIESCDQHFANCDGKVATGCESDTRSDPDHCGSCDACPGGNVCVESACHDPEWANWVAPPDSPPPTNFTTTDDTVADLTTGLLWQRNISSQTYSFANAQTYCASLAITPCPKWRLPTMIELTSIVDFGVKVPAIDGITFPSTIPQWYWTASPDSMPSHDDGVWSIGFGYGVASFSSLAGPLYVRCVCGRPPTTAGSAGAPPGRYEIINGGDTDPQNDAVRDTKTNLVWQRALAGSTGTWSAANDYCATLGTVPNYPPPWRLPTIKELRSLVDVRRSDPAFDSVAFPFAPGGGLWSSTPYVADSPVKRWKVDIASGHSSQADPANTTDARARCVREP